MNLLASIALTAGGPGSGCQGENCGRPQTGALYHVTHTGRLPSIRKKGLLPMQTSNWAHKGTGERYGLGEVHTFNSRMMALRWAAKMDRKMYGDYGTGKVSILKLSPGEEKWEVDTNDPLHHFEGDWLKHMGRIPPERIQSVEPFKKEHIQEIIQENNKLSQPLKSSGTSEGAEKGWDERGRGRAEQEHKLGKFLQDSAKVFGENNVWSKLAKYGHPGKVEPFTKEEQKDLRRLKSGVGNCKVGFCIMNAQKLAITPMGLDDPRVKYIEGLVTVHGVPIDHAWIEFDDKVYDPTLANEKWQMKDPGKTGKTQEPGEYFGVEVPKNEIMKHQFKTRMYDFMSHYRGDDKLMQKIWK